MSALMQSLRDRLAPLKITFDSDSFEEHLDIHLSSEDLTIAFGKFTNPEDCNIPNDEADDYAFWINEDGDLTCGSKFIDTVADYVKACIDGDTTSSWEDFLSSLYTTA